MTTAICSNEHDLIWVYDDTTKEKWFSKPSTPPGTYFAIAAAFVGEPYAVVYLQETASKHVLLADTKWMGVLSCLGLNMSDSPLPSTAVADYTEFCSPEGSLIKLAASDYIQESKLSYFDLKTFYLKSRARYGLQFDQIKAAVSYAQKIQVESHDELSALFELDSIERSAKELIGETVQMADDFKKMADEFLSGLNIN